MDIEDRLRERLGPASGRPLPSPGFEERVRHSLAPRVAARRSWRAVEALLGMAAVLALAVAALPWFFGRHPGPAVSATGTPTAVAATASTIATVSPTATASPTPSPVSLVHATKWFLSFDYPSDWRLDDRNTFTGKMGLGAFAAGDGRPTILGFLGTGSGEVQCRAGSGDCSTAWSLGDNEIVVRVGVASARDSVRNPYIWTAERAIGGKAMPGAEAITIGGLPSRYIRTTTNAVPYTGEQIPGATEVLWWGLPSQRWYQQGWSIVAAIRGPRTAELEAEAQALVESIHFVPDVTPLPSEPAALEALEPGILREFYANEKKNANDEHVLAFDCFPTAPGTSREATITQTPSTNPLTRPLPVSCSVTIAPNAVLGWTITLTQTWKSGPDYPAGSASTRYETAPNGDALVSWPLDDPAAGPGYPHQGKSKSGG